MKQKGYSQNKQYVNKTDRSGTHGWNGDGLRPSERSVGALADVPARFQLIPLEACMDCAATFDPNVNYANVLASLLQLLATRDAD